MDNTTERLAKFAAEMRFDLLSDETVHECKRRLIDTVASAMAGYGDPVCRMARGMAKKRPSDPADQSGKVARAGSHRAQATRSSARRA